MKRSHQPTPTNLRKSRITNKARLRIHHGNLDSSDPFFLDPDQAPQSQTRNYGLDSEDANEHHLQQVLSAAAELTQAGPSRPSRNGFTAPTPAQKPAVFIPTPDSTGIVADFDKLYPPGTWVDPATYIKSSQTVEQCTTAALANGFAYYMDERDKEWLDKNNEEARGEGTSAQGASAALANNVRNNTSRSAKAKGKEPEANGPFVLSEDDFELVMGLFEKVTYEKTEYLHHSLDTGMAFPAFADYQETFASPLLPTAFASFTVPKDIPEPAQLVRMARAIYPHWRERRIERGGHRIIPVLNGDETDTFNESYICFRRREIKAARKTRASQVTSNDKLIRLNTELALVGELASMTLKRELLKKESSLNSATVWGKRNALVDLKRKFPSLGDKVDEELLIDKERVPKKPKLNPSLKVRTTEAISTATVETAIRPRERFAAVQSNIERELMRTKDRDHSWDDTVDASYQPLPVSFAARAFKYISPSTLIADPWPPSSSGSSVDSEDEQPAPRQPRTAVRLRCGRGGRIMIDRRREPAAHTFSIRPRSSILPQSRLAEQELASDAAERSQRLLERWRFDADDVPSVGPDGSDELDRALLDDYDTRYMRQALSVHKDSDVHMLTNDASLVITNADGRQQAVLPFRLGHHNPLQIRREPPRTQQHHHQPANDAAKPSQPLVLPIPATPISQPTQMKKMAPPSFRPVVDGSMRPPAVPVIASMPPPNVPTPPQPQPQSQPHPHQMNGTRNGISIPHVDVPKAELVEPNDNTINASNHRNTPSPSIPNGVIHVSPLQPQQNRADHNLSPPARPLSQNQQDQQQQQQLQQQARQNGYRYPSYPSTNTLNNEQMQRLKSVFTNGEQAAPARPAYGLPNGAVNFSMVPSTGPMQLKMPPARNQWANTSSPVQRPSSAIMNGSSPNGAYAMNGISTPTLRMSRGRVHEAES